MQFPEGFVEKYKEILGDEARDFLASFEEEAVSAFRVNFGEAPDFQTRQPVMMVPLEMQEEIQSYIYERKRT
ncbi:NOL1/NOP2/sun family protein [Streptococcus pneumoniae]|nr:NOL1/NOP2/sun family protein [Streptococcus pneumoniae]